jgi:hypothetical protein
MSIRYRTPFAPEFNFIVKRPMTFNGHAYETGEEFDKANVNDRVLRRLYDSRYIDAVIPSLMLKQGQSEPEAAPEPAPAPKAAPKAAPEPAAKPKGKRKAATAPEPKPEAQAPHYRLDDGFGVFRIFDGETLVRECATAEEAKAAMAELSGE